MFGLGQREKVSVCQGGGSSLRPHTELHHTTHAAQRTLAVATVTLAARRETAAGRTSATRTGAAAAARVAQRAAEEEVFASIAIESEGPVVWWLRDACVGFRSYTPLQARVEGRRAWGEKGRGKERMFREEEDGKKEEESVLCSQTAPPPLVVCSWQSSADPLIRPDIRCSPCIGRGRA